MIYWILSLLKLMVWKVKQSIYKIRKNIFLDKIQSKDHLKCTVQMNLKKKLIRVFLNINNIKKY